MKAKLLTAALSLFLANAFAQDRTTVNAMNSEISDNLDLRAVASIFGDSKDLEDFEYRLNDPKNQISNLDLNNDNQVDYLRVIETTEGRTHIIVIQSILGKDLFQDVATVEVERDSNNRVQVQVVGDVYMYGTNYIYEPVYVTTPVIYTYFWTPNYRPYCSSWYWGYYPSYYYAWSPCPIFRYRSHIGLYINFNHHYNYVNYRRCHVAYTNYYGRRANGYERQYPNRSFTQRHSGYTNRYELDRTRNIRTVGTRNEVASANPRSGGRNEATTNTNYGGPRVNPNPRTKGSLESTTTGGPRVNTNGGGRNETSSSTTYGGPRVNTNGGGRNETSTSTTYGGPRVNTNGGGRNETSTSTTYGGPKVNTNGGGRSETSTSTTYGGPRVNTNGGGRNETSTSTTYGGPRVNTNGGGRSETSTSTNYGGPRVNTNGGGRNETSTSSAPRSTPRSGGSEMSTPRSSGSSGMTSAPRGNSGGGGSSRGGGSRR
ncbi:hypothetical protein [Flavobacterium sp.]|uniref:hypothetical protein n=1 Tax=Flavobacterium sp. TaxID=239 RepID=UPI002B4B2C99|nr:hypothetical protein [Flavobacterium sp.]HLP63926.1 hypothetical protein [Flavobacterium sp.]